MKLCVGEKKVNDKKKPTQVPVHNIHCIKSEINLNTGLVKLKPLSLPAKWIKFLNPLNIDP
jgi:hypothetical protein